MKAIKEIRRAMRATVLLTVVFLLLTSVPAPQSQDSGKPGGAEQSSFGGEEVPGIPFIKRPVSIPPAVLQILKQDETVKGCLSENEPTPEKHFASWFVAATVHLGGPSERDLVVLPNPRANSPDFGCFHSASGIQSIWLLRQIGRQYRLVLATTANGINILPDRHAGLRDIRSGTIGSAGRFITTVIFHFDGSQYQKYHEETTEQQ
jgi:hypothetical protein